MTSGLWVNVAEAGGWSLLGRSVIAGRSGVSLLGHTWSHGESEFHISIVAEQFLYPTHWASLTVQLVKNPPAMQVTLVRFLGWEYLLENRHLEWPDHTPVSLFLPLRKLRGHSVYRKETKSTRVLMELDTSVGGGAWGKRPFPPNWDSCLLQAGDIIPPVTQTLPSSSNPISSADPSLSTVHTRLQTFPLMSFLYLLLSPVKAHCFQMSQQNLTMDFLVVQWIRICLPVQGTWV